MLSHRVDVDGSPNSAAPIRSEAGDPGTVESHRRGYA